ncbi:ABC transporter ATP-binding protein [Prochlorococcus marinus]|uniref:ATPase n=1 Tax=Prochlorococcus marinus XMU1408 TaxID=2213228 RepID=A0A318R293_PROMR|nr:ATP-binding cassette domain-containing protein [Prochlorococcus marinus]MBW3041815.1 ATPase [Prochlorococcus marinus str. XMU1408]PYE02955.1 ATPase [Prochlorococcus marinus XMU1408]
MVHRPKSKLISWAQVKNLNVMIDQKIILSNININLNFGENILILGPNGSGKSTFLKLLNRSIYPLIERGSSFKLFNKENINIWDLRKDIGFLFKDMENRVNKGVKLKDLIISGFTGTFNERYSKLISKDDMKNVESLIIQLDIQNIVDKEFHSLSDGQKRRGMLARALVYRPKLLVLDEPFCNLDIKSNSILNKTLLKLIDKSLNIIYITHSLESILPLTNRVLLIKGGKIINDGTPEELINSEVLSELYNISIKVIKQGSYWRSIV